MQAMAKREWLATLECQCEQVHQAVSSAVVPSRMTKAAALTAEQSASTQLTASPSAASSGSHAAAVLH